MSQTSNLLIDLIAQSQAQKEVTANDAFTKLESAICAVTTLTVTTADVTVTDAQFRSAVLKLTGTLTGNRAVIVPARSKPFVIDNQTSGAYTVTVKVSGQTGIVVTQGTKALCYADGTDVRSLSDSFAANVHHTVYSPTYAATTTIDWSKGSHQRVTLTGNVTFALTGAIDGQVCTLEVIQDATGSRTATWGSEVVFGTDITGATLTTTASKRDFMRLIYNSATGKYYVTTFVKGY
jgi:hypothetical protein